MVGEMRSIFWDGFKPPTRFLGRKKEKCFNDVVGDVSSIVSNYTTYFVENHEGNIRSTLDSWKFPLNLSC